MLDSLLVENLKKLSKEELLVIMFLGDFDLSILTEEQKQIINEKLKE